MCLPRVYSTSEHGSHMGIWKQKANTIRHQHIIYAFVGHSTVKEKNHLLRTHGIVGICLRRHLRLLLWHSREANRTPHCVSQNQPWQQNHMKFIQCCLVHRGGSHCTSHSYGCFKAHNCHKMNGSNSSHSNLRHNEKHTIKKNIHYNNSFL